MPCVSNVQKACAIGQIAAGMLQKDLAERLGVSPGNITKWKQKFRRRGMSRINPGVDAKRSRRNSKTVLSGYLLYIIEDDRHRESHRERITNERTQAGLRQIRLEEWNAVPQQRIRKLIKSMRRRCQAVVQALGSSARYWALTNNWWNQRSQFVTMKMKIHSNQAPASSFLMFCCGLCSDGSVR